MANMSVAPNQSKKPVNQSQLFAGPIATGANIGAFRATGQTTYGSVPNLPASVQKPQQPGPTPRSSEVIGTSTQSSYSQPQQPQTYRDQGTGQEFPNYDAYLNELNNVYGGSESYLNDAENAVRADYPNAMAEAEAMYKTNASTLGGQKQSAFDTLNQQQTKATQTNENALADARRLYQEQQIGAQQRFGGSSSAGQAVSEIQAREQARQFGNTQRQYADTTNQIETQRANIDREYQSGLLQLEQQKQSGIAQATRDFQNKLLQISNSRAMLGQAKAEAKLQALQQLRNEVFAINQQNTQFSQQIELMRQQAQMQLGNFSGAANKGVGTAQAATNNFNPQITAPYGATSGLGIQNPQQSFTGAISRRPEEQYIGSVNTRDPYRLQG